MHVTKDLPMIVIRLSHPRPIEGCFRIAVCLRACTLVCMWVYALVRVRNCEAIAVSLQDERTTSSTTVATAECLTAETRRS